MTLAADALLTVLVLAAAAWWTRPVALWCGRWPWWVTALPLAALLGAAAWLAAVSTAGPDFPGAGRVLAVAAAVLGGNPIATSVLRGARGHREPAGDVPDADVPDADVPDGDVPDADVPDAAAPVTVGADPPGQVTVGAGRAGDRELLRGGLWIGALERAGTAASLLAGSVEGVALVLAVKGVGRYPELRGRTEGMTEHFIIGTFASVLWAAAAAGVGFLLS